MSNTLHRQASVSSSFHQTGRLLALERGQQVRSRGDRARNCWGSGGRRVCLGMDGLSRLRGASSAAAHKCVQGFFPPAHTPRVVRGLLLISIDRSVPYLVGRLYAISTLGGSENSSNGRRPETSTFVTCRDDSSNLVLLGFFHAQRISCAGARDIEKQGQLSIPGPWKFPAWEISLALELTAAIGTNASIERMKCSGRD